MPGLDQDLLQRGLAVEARENAAATQFAGTVEVANEIDTKWQPKSAPQDDDWSYLGEASKAVWGAVVDATTESMLFLADISRTMGSTNAEAELRMTNWFTEEQIQEMLSHQQTAASEGIEKVRSAVDVVAPDNKTTGGAVARGIGQFLVPFLGWSKVAQGAGVTSTVGRGLVAGFATDISAFDPNEGNLSTLVEQYPALKNPITDFLATSPDDDAATNRLRNGVEGLVLGVASEGVIKGFVKTLEWYRAGRAVRARDLARAEVNLEKDIPVEEPSVVAKVETPEQAGKQLPVEPIHRMVFHNVDENGVEATEGGFTVNITDDKGKIVGDITGGTRGGDVVQVTGAEIADTAARGKGYGVAAYERLLAQAHQQGRRVVSDTVVSDDAARVYDALERRGHTVKRNADFDVEVGHDGRTQRVSNNNRPLFEVEYKAPEAPKPQVTGSGIEVPSTTLRDTLRTVIRISPEKRQALIDAVENEDYSKALGLIDFNADKIDWSKMDEGDNLRQLLNTFSETLADVIDKAKGGVQTLKQTQRLANLVGASAEQARNLFQDVRGNRGLAARMLAAERAMLASGQRLVQLAREAKSADVAASTAARVELHRHIELHSALMAEVKGSKTEIARALNAMRIMRSASAESFREFDNVRRLMGGGHKDTDAVIDAVLQQRGSLQGLNAVVIKTAGRRWQDAITELVVNGLLSQPKTHLINMASNIVNTMLTTADRYVAGLTHVDRNMVREANLATAARMNSIVDAFKLAAQAWREGKPITDIKQRLEFDTRRAITHELFGSINESGAFAKVVNAFGAAIRLPGRALMAGDEFFKVINMRGETAALAYREAAQEASARGLKGDKFATYVTKRQAEMVASPPPGLAARAIEAARRVSFQESPRTGFGRQAERFINAEPIVKLIFAPFFRTPMNILRQAVVDRTPFSILMDETRKTLAAGGPEAAIARARVFNGMGAMAAGAMLVSSGGEDKPFEIVGKRPYGNTAMEDHVLDYSIRLGDTWFQFNRLDPVGTWLGMSADMNDHMRLEYDPADPESASYLFSLGQAAFGSFMNNTMNKSWFTSVQDVLDTISDMEDGRPATVERAVQRLAAANALKLVPYSGLIRGGGTSIEKLVTGEDAEVKEAWTFWDRVQANFPSINRSLPPKRDYLGRPITRANSALFALNPFATSPESHDPLDRELARLSFDYQILPKSIDEGKVQLNAAQYSELKRLIGQEPLFGGTSLQQQLSALVQSDTYRNMPTDAMRTKLITDMYSMAKSIAVEQLKLQNGGELMKASLAAEFAGVTRITGQQVEVPEISFPTGQ